MKTALKLKLPMAKILENIAEATTPLTPTPMNLASRFHRQRTNSCDDSCKTKFNAKAYIEKSMKLLDFTSCQAAEP